MKKMLRCCPSLLTDSGKATDRKTKNKQTTPPKNGTFRMNADFLGGVAILMRINA